MVLSCQNLGEELMGEWVVRNRHYKATYSIKRELGDLKGQILRYSDGTTDYTFNGRRKMYLFENLEQGEMEYYDGVSSATSKSDAKTEIRIRALGSDTLEVTEYLYGRPNTNLWVRKTRL